MAQIRRFTEPQYLYRYRSVRSSTLFERELEAIEKHQLWFSHFEDLNDPMERMYDLRTQIGALNQTHIADRIYIEKSSLGICSFSEVNEHEVMWAHYADQCKGICIRYYLPALLDGLAENIDLVRVSYNDYPHLVSRQASQDQDIAKKILSNKNYRWLYEREWRLFSPKRGLMRIRDEDSISCVYIGNRMDPGKKRRLIAALEGQDIQCRLMQVEGYSIKFPRA